MFQLNITDLRFCAMYEYFPIYNSVCESRHAMITIAITISVF
jgi:hypothetical protein